MGQYIFRPPAAAYTRTIAYESMAKFLDEGRSEEWPYEIRKMGNVARVERSLFPLAEGGRGIRIRLYDTVIATLWPNGAVTISEEVDRYHSHATRWWLSKIMRDNNHGGYVYSEGFKYHDGGIRIAGRTYG